MSSPPLDKVFNPFISSQDIANSKLSYDDYERVKDACAFHLPGKMGSAIIDDANKLNIMHLNARSMLKKQEELNGFIAETNIKWHIISISETWLSKPLEPNYCMHGYQAFYCSRDGRVGGGSAIYINDHLLPKQLITPTFTTAEVVCAEMKLNQLTLIICQIYRAPNSDPNQFNIELDQCLTWLSKMKKTSIITGDFNFNLFALQSNAAAQTFFTTMCSHSFFPTISRTTRSAHPSNALLDNIFLNELSKVALSGVIISDLSDHFPIFASLIVHTSPESAINNPASITSFNYRMIDELKHFLAKELNGIENEPDPEVIASKIVNTYNEGITNFSYTKQVSRKNSPRKPWVSPALIISIAHKNELFINKLKQPSHENINKYNQYRNILTNLLRKAKRSYYNNEFSKHSGSSKETWKTLQTLLNAKHKNDSLPTRVIDEDGKETTDDKNIAENLNTFFTEVGQNLKDSIPPSNLNPLQLLPDIDNEMDLTITNEEELVMIIDKLNNVGAGADKINAKIFKLTYKVILKQILHLFNRCLESGIFPRIFKIAIIKPIYKNGDRRLVNNYRPISILPFMSKILEKIIYNRLIDHLNVNSIIHENQFGFQKKKSTYMPILLLQETITKAFEDGEFALCLYLDLKKAFDTVHIDLLLKKMKQYGVKEKSYKILASYLSDRTQCVKIRNTTSTSKNVNMGVPQGSILGPVLFILYINDLPKLSPNMICLSYADDTAIIFKNKDKEALQTIVNEHMLSITEWFNANFLSLNVSKTFTQHYSSRCLDFQLNVNINNTQIKEKEDIKYLGVVIDKSLKFSSHINHLSNIVSRNIGVIGRIRYFIDKRTALLLYNTLILPYLNYCTLIWGVNYASQLNKLVILQKKAMRIIENVFAPQSSEPIFKQYGVLKVTDIARSQMLIIMHKCVIRELPKTFDSLYILHADNGRHTRNTKHIVQPFSNRNYRLFTTTLLGPRLWNTIMTPLFQNRGDVPKSKFIIKKIIRKHFIDTYNT